MGKSLFVFPGQGSQAVGMCKDIFEKDPTAADLFRKASEYCEFDLPKLIFEGTEEELKKTENAQPAILVCSYALCSVLRDRGRIPSLVAGHSLGEYTAVAVSGMLSFKDTVKLVHGRGKLMAKVGKLRPGAMAAIIGLADQAVEELCREASATGAVVPANYNSPEQLVISGEVPGVLKAMDLAKAKGAKKVVQLQVSGAFHSPLMDAIAWEFQELLKEYRFLDTKIPVISNVSSEPVTSGETMRQLLLRQLNSPVRWVACMAKARETGADSVVEVGPGKVLSGLLRRIDRNMKSFSVEDLNGVSAYLGQEPA